MPLNSYMQTRNGTTPGASTPPPTNSEANSEAISHDRAYAREFKLVQKKTSSAKQFGQQQVYHTAQAPSQSSNTHHGSRFTHGTILLSQQAERGPIGLPDSDVESNFDKTSTSFTTEHSESDNGQSHYGDYENGHQGQFYQAEVSLEEPYTQEQSRRGQSSSPTKVRRSVPVTTGHYTAGYPRHHSDLPIPSSQNKGHNTKKRGRTEKPYQIQKKDVRADVDTVEHDGIGELLPAGGGLIHSEEEGEAEEDGFEDDDPDLGSGRGEATPTRHLEESDAQSLEEVEYREIKMPINPDSSTHSLDYPENELRKMEYSKLSTESWESDREAFTLPDTLKGATLDQQVDCYALNKDQGHWANQVAFYQSLNSKQWDEAGNHLLAQIGNSFKQIKDAKKQKRKVLEEIEAEIKAREVLVRGKSANIDAKFVAMQAGGEGLLKGKN